MNYGKYLLIIIFIAKIINAYGNNYEDKQAGKFCNCYKFEKESNLVNNEHL
jgi:hypothetical protein